MIASKNQARLVILTTFALGVLAGALGMNLFTPKPPARGERLNMVDQLVREVKLDSNQRKQVEQILAETRQKYEELQKQVNPKFTEIRHANRARIRSILTPEQQLLYEEWNRQRDQRHERQRDKNREKVQEKGK
jgi:Spy/CpxP family protein refolding chaperone